jgi:flavocytochrome c
MSKVTVTGQKVIVVGGGLAGMSAAHTVLERGGRVLVLDKKEFLGGNSVKATSGINGAGTRVQQKLGIPDTVDVFYNDTANGGKVPLKDGANEAHPLMKVLTYNSGQDVEWLIQNFGLDLSLVSQLGGHSFPRTHRGAEKFPGMTITYALMEKFEELAKQDPARAQVITLARVTELIYQNGAVIGVKYTKDGKDLQAYGPVIIATGGFGADFGKDSLLAKYRPDLLHLPTTNGDHCTGDGLKMSLAIGASSVDMTSVQVHPTGLVHPKDPDAKVKFLAAEALRGVGGLILDAEGNRIANELGTRDYVTGRMWEVNKAPYRLLLNSKASKAIEWHCKHYVGRGLMKKLNNGKEIAKEMGISESKLKQTFDKYNADAKKGTDEFGKKYFHNLPVSMDDTWNVAIITPVVHYCMGGIKIDEYGRIVTEQKKPIPGLFAAGEVAGGVHAKNRLGGSGLLGCVVYGRVSGASATSYQLNQLATQQALGRAAALTKQLGGITIQISFDGPQGGEGAAASVSSQQQPSPATPAGSNAEKESAAAEKKGESKPQPKEQKEYSMEEIAKHNKEDDCWVAVNGQVLDVTSFLDRHPGGKPALLLYAGKEASEEFNMLHEANVIEKYAPEVVIGTYKQEK